ncbi:hypothetical protein C8255_02060 [filamentous cyanobacterium CCP3]|nr:hypothetical protein C8255_02060 [filamentous cyanobacterium CCP3]
MPHRLSWLSLLPLPLLLWGMPGLATELEQTLVERRHSEVFLEVAQPLPIIDGNKTLSGQTQQNNDSASSRQAEANRLLQEGIDKYNRNDWQAALTPWKQASEIYQAIGDRAGVSQILNNIGSVYQLLGNFPEALAQYEASLAIKHEIGDWAGEAKTLVNLGTVNVNLNM